MFNNFLMALMLCVIFEQGYAQDTPKAWKLVWQEEFDYTGLPDPAKWSYEVGHVRNQEQQYYTSARKENIWVENGVLTITGRKEKYPNQFYIPGSKDWKTKDSLASYTSASINTLGKAGWKYGRIEVRAKIAHGPGIWPAIWMKGTNNLEVKWPKCGEIDIMEFVGNHPSDIYGTLHFLKPGTDQLISNGGITKAEKPFDDFHIYAIEWDKDRIDLFYDDINYHSVRLDDAGDSSQDNPFRKPFYLLLNLALGANWPGPIDDKVLPQKYWIDYVRVYEKK